MYVAALKASRHIPSDTHSRFIFWNNPTHHYHFPKSLSSFYFYRSRCRCAVLVCIMWWCAVVIGKDFPPSLRARNASLLSTIKFGTIVRSYHRRGAMWPRGDPFVLFFFLPPKIMVEVFVHTSIIIRSY